MITLTTRYFAGAAEAAGVDSETLTGAPTATLSDVLRGKTERLDRVLDVATLLADGRRVDGATALGELGADSIALDVLPPFAGG